jgi:sugar phosphate isomerase/epimerase
VRLAVSNIALPEYAHERELTQLGALGLSAVEVAPSRVWREAPTAIEVARYRRAVEDAGLAVVGLHSLFFDQPELGLFERREETLRFLVGLSALCRDLGGRTLIWGGGRERGAVPLDEARRGAVSFMLELVRRVEGHGTTFCFEPLGPTDTDFIHLARESLDIVNELNHPALAVQLDAKALVANGEAEPATVAAVAHRLVHFHANEPDLGVLGSSGEIDHRALGAALRDVAYDGFVSIEQRQLDSADPMKAIAASARVAKDCYGG